MAEETTETEGTEGSDRPLAGAALKSALEKERKDRKELEKTVKSLQQRLDAADEAAEKAKREQADADKSEMDKLVERLARVEAERDNERAARETADQDRARVERVRRHASEFADADDVVALLRGRGELDGIEDDDTAERMLAELKRDKPHLLKQEQATSGLEQLLNNGQPQFPKPPSDGTFTPADKSAIVPYDALNAMSETQLRELQTRDPGLYERSMNALSGYDANGMKIVTH